MRTIDDRDFSAALADIQAAPLDVGVIAHIVRRPSVDEREVVDEAALSTTDGLVGNGWRSPVGRAHRMRGVNARVLSGGTIRRGDAIRRL